MANLTIPTSYIICLSKIPASLKTATALKKQLKAFGMRVELFEGTYGDDAVAIMEEEGREPHPWGIKGPPDPNLPPPDPNAPPHPSRWKILRPGVKGCFLSHYRLWQKCVELDKPIIVWEDDIQLTRPFVPIDWDDVLIVALGHPSKSVKYQHFLDAPEGTPQAEHYGRSSMPGCCGYAIKPHAARKLLEIYDNTYLPADNAINQYHVKIQIHNYIMGTAILDKLSLTSASSFWANNPQRRGMVFASYFTGTPDPQRNKTWSANTDELMPLINSVIDGGLQIKIFHDCFENPPEIEGCEWVRCSDELTGIYTASVLRWFRYLDYLKSTDEKPDALFMVDSTDVVMFNNPFAKMDEHQLYCGDEFKTSVNSEWLQRRGKHFSAPDYQTVLDPFWNERLVNAGLVGGSTGVCLEFLELLTNYHRLYNTVTDASLSLDMPAFNYTVWKHFSDRVVHGDPVNTRFKKNEKDKTKWWKHK